MKLRSILVAASILSSAMVRAEMFFATDFESGVPSEFSGVTTLEGVQGYADHGFSGSFLRNLTSDPPEKTILTLTGLPAHDFISIGFLLAIIDTWDGAVDPSEGGPDLFNVTLDGNVIFSEHFQNAYGGDANYAAPPGVLLVEKTQLGFRNSSINDRESGFSMGNDPAFQWLPHTGSTVVIEWFASGEGWDHTSVGGANDESWAIDDVFVFLSSIGDLPTVRIDRVGPDEFELSYCGILQSSERLGSWIDVSPQPISPWRIRASSPTRFFRARGRQDR